MEFKNLWHLKYVPLNHVLNISRPQVSYAENENINIDVRERLEGLSEGMVWSPDTMQTFNTHNSIFLFKFINARERTSVGVLRRERVIYTSFKVDEPPHQATWDEDTIYENREPQMQDKLCIFSCCFLS